MKKEPQLQSLISLEQKGWYSQYESQINIVQGSWQTTKQRLLQNICEEGEPLWLLTEVKGKNTDT